MRFWNYDCRPTHLLQAVLGDEPAEYGVPGRELIVQRLIGAAGREIDVRFKPGIVDTVVISAAPTVVVVPVVDLQNVEFAAGGKACGEIKGSAALAVAVAHKDVERGNHHVRQLTAEKSILNVHERRAHPLLVDVGVSVVGQFGKTFPQGLKPSVILRLLRHD